MARTVISEAEASAHMVGTSTGHPLPDQQAALQERPSGDATSDVIDVSARLYDAHQAALGRWRAAAPPPTDQCWSGPEENHATLKRLEGAATALRDARRCVERGGRTPFEAIRYVQQEWAEMRRFRWRREWIAYVDGGLGALATFLAELGSSSDSPDSPGSLEEARR